MNPQEVSEMVGRQVQQGLQQVQQSLLEQLSERLRDVQLGRPPPQAAGADAPMGLDGLPADEEDADDNSVDGPDWSLYLTGAKTQPSTDAGSALSDLFGQPPALGLIQHTKGKLSLYEGVPATPPARHQNYRDRQVAAVQQKLESAMHLLVTALEKPDHQVEYLHTVGAFVRSAFEDLQQQRRGAIAGARRHKLEPRPDDDSARLFSREEDKMLATQYGKRKQGNKRNSRPQQQQQQQQNTQRTDSQKPQQRKWRSQSKSGEKGKGK